MRVECFKESTKERQRGKSERSCIKSADALASYSEEEPCRGTSINWKISQDYRYFSERTRVEDLGRSKLQRPVQVSGREDLLVVHLETGRRGEMPYK